MGGPLDANRPSDWSKKRPANWETPGLPYVSFFGEGDLPSKKHRGAIAQLGERWLCKPAGQIRIFTMPK